MAINAFRVSYNDFELGQIINPDEFDVNFADIMVRFNQIIDVLNQITDGIGGDGASIVHIGDIPPFLSTNLQDFLEELVAQLQESGPGSGAEFIGSLPIVGLAGGTVHEQILSLNTLLTDLRNDLESEAERLDIRVDETNAGLEALEVLVNSIEERVTQNEANIALKANQSDVYTKAESQVNYDNVEANIHNDFYDKVESDDLLDNKTDVTGDHAGTWQGLDVGDMAGVIGAEGVSISLTRPTSPSEGMLWFNPSNNEYQLYLNGQWRINSRPTQIKQVQNRIVLNSDVSEFNIGIPEFDADLDAFIVFQNSVLISRGEEYNVLEDGETIENVDGVWESGTTFDVISFISLPNDDDKIHVLSDVLTEDGEDWEVE